MVFLLLGGVSLVVLMAALGMFSRAQLATLKLLGVWIIAIGGLLLAVLLAFTKGPEAAIAALVMLGPLVWSWIGGKRPSLGQGSAGQGPASGAGSMSRAEAYSVLGLRPGASKAEIREAHRRLMSGAHPDHGGSDWLASRINAARDILLS
jgi:DnaJ family protein C protein 19